jgi:hypothetical protein
VGQETLGFHSNSQVTALSVFLTDHTPEHSPLRIFGGWPFSHFEVDAAAGEGCSISETSVSEFATGLSSAFFPWQLVKKSKNPRTIIRT